MSLACQQRGQRRAVDGRSLSGNHADTQPVDCNPRRQMLSPADPHSSLGLLVLYLALQSRPPQRTGQPDCAEGRHTYRTAHPGIVSFRRLSLTRRRALFDILVNGTCQFCGQPDTKTHLFFNCLRTAGVRAQYESTLECPPCASL